MKFNSPYFLTNFINFKAMTFEEASDLIMLYSISPELTCTCDQYHTCQQCVYEEEKEQKQNNSK